MVLGHEGAGIIEEVGPGVTRVAPGDHVVCSFIPNCGTCRYCATGRQSICDMGATILEGYLPGERFPITGPRGQYGAMCMLGTFSQYGVIHQNSVRQGRRRPARSTRPCSSAAACPPGWGSAVNTADVRAGETVIVFGVGGIGINAVQGARYAGAKNVVAVDPLENKREKAHGARRHARLRHRRGGAAHAITDLTRGQMADSAILTPGLMTAEIVGDGFNADRQGRHRRPHRAQQARGAAPSSCPARSSRCSASRSRAACSATATRPPTSRRSSGCTRRATSSSTRSSPAPTPSSRSTRATTTCSTARTCAAWWSTSTDEPSGRASTRGSRAGRPSCSRPRCAAVRTSSWRDRPAPASPPCCARSRSPGTCRSCSSRATPSSRRRGWSGTSTPPGCWPTGYQPDVFVDGPLLDAMRVGGLLYVEELNRVPEETLNVLLTVMSEGELARAAARPDPRGARASALVAAMNPYDAVGTARISSALYDRTCRIAMGYQSDERRAADRRHAAARGPTPSGATGSSSWCGAPASTPTSASARRCAARSTSIGLAVELAGLRGVPVDGLARRAGGGQGRADRADPAARVQQPARPRRS